MAEEAAQPTDVLYQRAASIRAVVGGEVNPYSRAQDVLAAVAESLGAPIAIVGGLAAIRYKAQVTTLDIDVVVPADQLEAFVAEGQSRGLVLKKRSDAGWHRLAYRDSEGEVDIEVVPEGGRTPRDPEYAPPIPSPQQLGVEKGLGYASFAGWVAMKLVAGRDKDRYHLVEALKKADAAQIGEAVVAVRSMHASYLQELERLLRAAEDENQEDW